MILFSLPKLARLGLHWSRIMAELRLLKGCVFLAATLGVGSIVYQPESSRLADLPNLLPEAAPYITEEARSFPPPFEEYWQTQDSPAQCQVCHKKIFDEW